MISFPDVYHQPISSENVVTIATRLTLSTVRPYRAYCGKAYDRLYRGIISDTYNLNNPEYNFSDGYDLVQSAVLFLCEYYGKTVLDECIDNRGKTISICKACYHLIERELTLKRKRDDNEIALTDLDEECNFPVEMKLHEDEYIEIQNLERLNEIIDNLHLRKGLQEVFDCYYAGMSFADIAEYLGVMPSTVWKRRQRIQKLYNKYIQV